MIRFNKWLVLFDTRKIDIQIFLNHEIKKILSAMVYIKRFPYDKIIEFSS